MADSSYSPMSNKAASAPNTTKPSRQSLSILKPLKARCPLQDLDLVPNTEEDTTTTTTTTFSTMRRRRVSFAGVNKVKEFHTAAESLTVHHTPAYDEPFTTTMSSDSSGHHHLTDSKLSLSEGTSLHHSSNTDCIESTELDAVLDLTMKSNDNVSYKAHGDIDFDSKENLGNNFYAPKDDTYYEGDMECTNVPVNGLYDSANSKNSSFGNRSMEFTSVVPGYYVKDTSGAESIHSNKSMMEFTEVIRGPYVTYDNEQKSFESMEFTQQVGRLESSLLHENQNPVSHFEYIVRNESQTEFEMEFTQPMQHMNIFTGQSLNNSKFEPAQNDSNSSEHEINSVFTSHGNTINNSNLEDSNDMSIGMTGVLSHPLIECIKTAGNLENEIVEMENGYLGDFVKTNASHASGFESSNHGSEMEFTDVGVFHPTESAVCNTEAAPKTIEILATEKLKAKQQDVLSFLRSYSGADKNAAIAIQNSDSSLEKAEAIQRSLEKQAGNISINHQLSHSQINELSMSRNSSMEMTKAIITNNLNYHTQDNLSITEDPLKTDYEMSFSKDGSMELTKAVSNIVKYDSHSHQSVPEDLLKSASATFENSSAASGDVSDLLEDSPEKVINRHGKTDVKGFLANSPKQNNDCFDKSDYNSEISSLNEHPDALGTLDFNGPSVITSTQELKSSESDSVQKNTRKSVSVEAFLNMDFPMPQAGAFETIDFNAPNVITSTQELRSSKNDSVQKNTRKSMSAEAVLNLNNPVTQPGAFETIDFNAPNVITSTQELRSLKNDSVQKNSRKSMSAEAVLNLDNPVTQPGAFETIDFNAPNVITSTQELKSSERDPVLRDARKSVSVDAFLNLDNPVKRKTVTDRDEIFESQSDLMKLTKALSEAIHGASDCDSDFNSLGPQLQASANNGLETKCEEQNLSITECVVAAEVFPLNSDVSLESEAIYSQETVGSQPMEFTNIHPAVKTSNNHPLSADVSSSQLANHNSRKNRRSELFVPTKQTLNSSAFCCSENIAEESLNTESERNTSSENKMDPKISGSEVSFCITDEGKSQRAGDELDCIAVDFVSKVILNEDSHSSVSVNPSEKVSFLCQNNTSLTNAAESQEYKETLRCESLSTPKPRDLFCSVSSKSKQRKPEISFDCAYKIDDSQIFTKSMMELNPCNESSMFHAKPSLSDQVECFESSETPNVNENGLLASVMKSYRSDEVNSKEISVSCELSAKLNQSKGKVMFSSQLNVTKGLIEKNAPLQQIPTDMNVNDESFNTFGHVMKTPNDITKNSTLIKPIMNSMMSNFFDESEFTTPKENIPRTVFLCDDIECPTFSERTETLISKISSVTIDSNQVENNERLSSKVFCENSLSENQINSVNTDTQSLLENSTSQNDNQSSKSYDLSDKSKFEISENPSGGNFEKNVTEENNTITETGNMDTTVDVPLKTGTDTSHLEKSDFVTLDTFNDSIPETEITVNEELLKNITVYRSKFNKKSARKSRCFTDLDNSISRHHDEDVKKVRISQDLCEITGIAKLADFTASSAEVSTHLEKPALNFGYESKMDISMTSVGSPISNNQSSSANAFNDHNSSSDKSNKDSEGCMTGVDEHNLWNKDPLTSPLPDILVTEPEGYRKNMSESKKTTEEVSDSESESNAEVSVTSESVWKKDPLAAPLPDILVTDPVGVQEIMSEGNKTTEEVGGSVSESNVKVSVTSELSKEATRAFVNTSDKTGSVERIATASCSVSNLFVSSGKKKRGFVKQAAELYDSFVSNPSPVAKQARTSEVDDNERKRILDEKCSDGKELRLKEYLESVNPSANVTAMQDIECLSPKEPDESLKYTPFTPDIFEKSEYHRSANSNSSMLCTDGSVSPIFKTPLSVAAKIGSTISKRRDLLKTPQSSSKSKQKLPFESTPLKNCETEARKKEKMQEVEMDSEECWEKDAKDESIITEKIVNSVRVCPEFWERFNAVTRPTETEWNLIEAESTRWSFTFLYSTVQLIIHFTQASSCAPMPMKNITLSCLKSTGTKKPTEDPRLGTGRADILAICQNILLQKYPNSRLKSSCRNSSNVFDLLHMISNDVIFIKKLMQSLWRTFNATFEDNIVKFELHRINPNHLTEVSIDLRSWESLSSSSISIINWIGTLRLTVIQSLFEEIEKDDDCIRKFWVKCNEYVKSIPSIPPPV